MQKYGLFISYSHKDSGFANALTGFLSVLSPVIDVWIDHQSIRPTDLWQQKINDALRDRHLLILIISPNALKSPYVWDEINAFLRDKKPILPLYYLQADLPPDLSAIQYIDWRAYPSEPEKWDELSKQVAASVCEQRLKWLQAQFAPIPLNELELANDLAAADDPHALDILLPRFEQAMKEHGEFLGQFYIHLIARLTSPKAREAYKDLRSRFDHAEYLLLKREFAKNEKKNLQKGNRS